MRSTDAAADGFFNNLGVMSRVIVGLIIRETKTRFGKHRLGYIWALIEPTIFVMIFGLLRSVLRDRIPFGESILLFIIPGLLFVRIFIGISGRLVPAISSNKALLAYPPVKPIDVVFARFALELLTMLFLLVLFFFVLQTFLETKIILDYVEFAGAVFAIFMLAFGIGTFSAVFSILWPTWERIWSFTSLPILILSGVFYLPSGLPPEYQYYLSFNPVLHCVEWMRVGVYMTYDPVLDRTYPIAVGLFMLTLALMLERLYRYKLLVR